MSEARRELRVLAITRLFPNAVEPHAASFNRQQLSALGGLCSLEVLAAIPHFPGARMFARWSRAGRLGEVPTSDRIGGLFVRHPRVLYLPKVGDAVAPLLYGGSLLPHVRRLRGRVDVVLGLFGFPDAPAAVWLAGQLGVPAAVKLHGTDINVLAERPAIRRWTTWTLARAGRVIAVSRPLAERAIGLGAPRARVLVVRNGVDARIFQPGDRQAARRQLGVADDPAARWILYVGRLERPKGVLELLQAFATIAARDASARLALVGSGSEEARCRALSARFPGRVVVAGARPLAEVARWLAACDLLALPSWNEGMPNVVLEALSAGRRVVATAVGGIPDVVGSPTVGELVPPRDVPALTGALLSALRAPYDPMKVAAFGPGDWSASAAALHGALAALACEPSPAARARLPSPSAAAG